MAAYRRVDDLQSPAGWLPVHRDQLRAQRSVSSMGSLYLFYSFGTKTGLHLLFHLFMDTECWFVLWSFIFLIACITALGRCTIATDWVAWSVCHDREPCNNGCTNRDAVWNVDLGGPKEPCVRWGRDSHVWRGSFEGKKGPDQDTPGHW